MTASIPEDVDDSWPENIEDPDAIIYDDFGVGPIEIKEINLDEYMRIHGIELD
jgi:hypothetical protein